MQQGAPAITLADIAAAQANLQETLQTVELFAIRLEQALAGREIHPPQAAPNGAVIAAVCLSSLAFVASCVALGRIVLGG